MSEKKKKERVMEGERKQREEEREVWDQNKQQLSFKHIQGVLHVFKVNN